MADPAHVAGSSSETAAGLLPPVSLVTFGARVLPVVALPVVVLSTG
ncbi:hypothetical protein [Cellulomonas sp. P5_C6]